MKKYTETWNLYPYIIAYSSVPQGEISFLDVLKLVTAIILNWHIPTSVRNVRSLEKLSQNLSIYCDGNDQFECVVVLKKMFPDSCRASDGVRLRQIEDLIERFMFSFVQNNSLHIVMPGHFNMFLFECTGLMFAYYGELMFLFTD